MNSLELPFVNTHKIFLLFLFAKYQKNMEVDQFTVRFSFAYCSIFLQADVVNALCSAVKDCKNFKVRINAALALTTPHQRCQYGDAVMYSVVWKGLIEALGTAEDISDYIDFRYRDSLTDQVKFFQVV